MKVYCKRQPVGAFLYISDSWKIYNYHYDKGFIPTEELYGHQDEKLPYFMTFEDSTRTFETLEELCDALFNSLPLIRANFWLVYYYSYDNVCVLAAEENYFEGSDYDVVEVDLKGVIDDKI